MNRRPLSGEQRLEVAARLEEIAEANGGRLTPEAVVEDAKDKNSPLHALFDWDVKKSAYAHWLNVARDVIKSVKVTVRTHTTDVRCVAYVRDPTAGPHEQGFVSVARLRTEEDEARDALIAEFQRIGDLLRRARNLALALQLEGDVDRIMSGVQELRDRVTHQPPPQAM